MATPARGIAVGLDLAALDEITAAVESGAGLPELARAAARALDAGLMVLDRTGAVLASAPRSPADERSLLDRAEGVECVELRVADAPVGELRWRPRAGSATALVKLVATMVASEVERLRAPERASADAVTALLHDVLARGSTATTRWSGARSSGSTSSAAGSSWSRALIRWRRRTRDGGHGC